MRTAANCFRLLRLSFPTNFASNKIARDASLLRLLLLKSQFSQSDQLIKCRFNNLRLLRTFAGRRLPPQFSGGVAVFCTDSHCCHGCQVKCQHILIVCIVLSSVSFVEPGQKARRRRGRGQYEQMTTLVARHSGLQKQVLQLYRDLVRAAKAKVKVKPVASDAPYAAGFLSAVRAQFRADAAVPKSQFSHIEYLLRKGHKQLAVLRSPSARGLSLSHSHSHAQSYVPAHSQPLQPIIECGSDSLTAAAVRPRTVQQGSCSSGVTSGATRET